MVKSLVWGSLLSKGLVSVVLGLCIVGLSGCNKEEDLIPVRVFIEASEKGFSDAFAKRMKLVNSGLVYSVRNEPVLMERQILDVDLVRVQAGYALQFKLDDEGRRALYRVSVAEQGRTLILEVNAVPIGARVIDGPIADGIYYTFVELTDREIELLAEELKKNAVDVQESVREHSLIR